eukprot:1028881-Rhodomonas_salina.4
MTSSALSCPGQIKFADHVETARKTLVKAMKAGATAGLNPRPRCENEILRISGCKNLRRVLFFSAKCTRCVGFCAGFRVLEPRSTSAHSLVICGDSDSWRCAVIDLSDVGPPNWKEKICQ